VTTAAEGLSDEAAGALFSTVAKVGGRPADAVRIG